MRGAWASLVFKGTVRLVRVVGASKPMGWSKGYEGLFVIVEKDFSTRQLDVMDALKDSRANI
jgi:hypothetical protein